MESGKIVVGDLLETADGNWRQVTSITPVANEETVYYNFTVAKDHDYFVGQTGFLAHNLSGCGCDGPLPTGPPVPKGTKLYRVWGKYARQFGRSWTRVDPRTIITGMYGDLAGLPNANGGGKLSEGILSNDFGVYSTTAAPLDGNVGGLDEVIVPDAENQIESIVTCPFQARP